ncbi:MAG: 50S ribosomal protein L6 [Erysipelotrichaceae bacterium]|jgi:large subunit ribosomal protein L6|nr:50S ribosomal protein L6 [Erysipelotrichaceae bacterium]
MSRIGNKLIELPAGVTVSVDGDIATVKGPKGTLTVRINHGITVHIEGNIIKLTRASELKQIKQNHGTSRANLNNAVVGVSEGFKKVLEMKGIGYKANMKGNDIILFAGHSHTVEIKPNEGAKIEVNIVNNQTEITVSGMDKQAVGQTAARIREVRPPEPYLGKGIRYKGEHITLKEGKRAAAGGKK